MPRSRVIKLRVSKGNTKMTHWKITAVQGTQTTTRIVHDVHDAVMVPCKMEQEGWHCTTVEHTPEGTRVVYQTENDPIQAGLDLCVAKLDAREAPAPWVGF